MTGPHFLLGWGGSPVSQPRSPARDPGSSVTLEAELGARGSSMRRRAGPQGLGHRSPQNGWHQGWGDGEREGETENPETNPEKRRARCRPERGHQRHTQTRDGKTLGNYQCSPRPACWRLDWRLAPSRPTPPPWAGRSLSHAFSSTPRHRAVSVVPPPFSPVFPP